MKKMCRWQQTHRICVNKTKQKNETKKKKNELINIMNLYSFRRDNKKKDVITYQY